MQKRNKQNLRNYYDILGGRLYDLRYRLEQEEKYSEILRHISFSSCDVVLDNGCGTGLLMEILNTYSVGVDLSLNLLSAARIRLKNKKNVHLIHGDVDWLPLKEMIFDKVFSITVIQNSPKPKRTLKEMNRVARICSEIVVTALKKSFTLKKFKLLLVDSGFKLRLVINCKKLKDWIIFAI